MFIHFWKTERDRAQAGVGQRKGDTESEADSRLWAVSTEPNVGLEPMNREIMTWSRLLNWLSHPGAPSYFLTSSLELYWFYANLLCHVNFVTTSVTGLLLLLLGFLGEASQNWQRVKTVPSICKNTYYFVILCDIIKDHL